MAAGVFKAKCLAVMEEVQVQRVTVLITARGKPVAKLVPVTTATDDIYGFYKDEGFITGDVVAPILSREE
jgi:hypothetical protein